LKNREKRVQMVGYDIGMRSLRRCFKTACSLMGVDRLAIEAMMGHSLTQFGIESVYDYCITHLDWLRDQYVKALPALTFVAELPPEVSVADHLARQRLEELEKQIVERDRLIRELQEERLGFQKVIMELEGRVEELQLGHRKLAGLVEKLEEKLLKSTRKAGRKKR